MTIHAFLLYIFAMVGIPVDQCVTSEHMSIECAQRAYSVQQEEPVKKTQVTPNANLISISNGF